MTPCSFDRLIQYLDKQLNLDQQLEVLEHLDFCETCREAIYQIARDRDAELFVSRPYKVDKILAG
jgi:predicted anti-sigma-YlaC factor YlaD